MASANGNLALVENESSESEARLSAEEMQQTVVDHLEHGKRLAWSFLKEWRVRMPQDEVESIVGASLCQAAKNFDPSRGVNFKTFLYYHLRGLFIKEISKIVRQQKIGECVTDGENIVSLEGHLVNWPFSIVEQETPEKIYEMRQRSVAAWTACLNLDSLEQEVLIRSFVHEESLVDIAKDMGYCRCHVSRVKSKAIKKLRSVLIVSDEVHGAKLGVLTATNINEKIAAKNYTGGRGRRKRRARKKAPPSKYLMELLAS